MYVRRCHGKSGTSTSTASTKCAQSTCLGCTALHNSYERVARTATATDNNTFRAAPGRKSNAFVTSGTRCLCNDPRPQIPAAAGAWHCARSWSHKCSSSTASRVNAHCTTCARPKVALLGRRTITHDSVGMGVGMRALWSSVIMRAPAHQHDDMRMISF